jgi:hypothetical protein
MRLTKYADRMTELNHTYHLPFLYNTENKIVKSSSYEPSLLPDDSVLHRFYSRAQRFRTRHGKIS